MYIGSPGDERGIIGNFALESFGQKTRLQLKATLIGSFILKDRMLNLGVFALLIQHQELPPRGIGEAMDVAKFHAKILSTNDTLVDTEQHHGIDNEGPKLLHEIQRQRRPAVMSDMLGALVGIKANGIHSAM